MAIEVPKIDPTTKAILEPKTNAAISKKVADDITAGNTPVATALNAASVQAAEAAQGLTLAGATFDAARLQSAATEAATKGTKLVAAGTITTSQPLVITGTHADLDGLTINYTGTGPAVTVGRTTAGSFISRVHYRLPRVVNTSKTGTGWADASGTIGVLVSNVYTGTIEAPYIRNFETGLQVQGIGAGVSYTRIFVGHFSNNKRNVRLYAGRGGGASMGWVNQNMFIGGRLSHDSNEGTVVPGTVQLLAQTEDNNPIWVNHNIFDNVSIESVNVVEWHVDWNGHFNYFNYCRWENVGAKPRVMWRANTLGNEINKGNNAHDIEVTKEAGTANSIFTYGTSDEVTMPGTNEASHYYENKVSSNAPITRFMGAGAASTNKDRKTQWLWEFAANHIKGKRDTDAHERIRLDNVGGRIHFSDGTAAPNTSIGAFGTSSMTVDGRTLTLTPHNTHDVGTASTRPRYIRAGTALVTGTATTAGRPTAATAGVGAVIFDTTLNKPVWSTGTAWVDATGATV